MSLLARAWHAICDFSGIDYLPYLAWKHFADDSHSRIPNAGPLLGELSNPEALKEALQYAATLLQHEEQRLDSMERKAFTLLGTTGVATPFVAGFAVVILDRSKLGTGFALQCAAGLYLLVVVALLCTVFLALRAVEVGRYRFTYPDLDEARRLSEVPFAQAQRERAETLFRCFRLNHTVVNNKANYLIGAQVWFRNTIVVLLFLTVLVAWRVLFVSQAAIVLQAPARTSTNCNETVIQKQKGPASTLRTAPATPPPAPAEAPPTHPPPATR
jgi:hypothetical protein